MVKLLYLLSILALLATCGVFARCAALWVCPDAELGRIRDQPDIAAIFRARVESCGEGTEEQTSPLVAQAQELASYLDPPATTAMEQPAEPALRLPPGESLVVHPAVPSLNFVLHGTSYCPDQPGRSMALIAEPGSSEADGRWVKEGNQLGHFVVHEIRKGIVVFRSGDDLHELAFCRRWPRQVVLNLFGSERCQSSARNHATKRAKPVAMWVAGW
ncbi:MAG TPA: hypothetical protein PLU87_10380 [Sedimentisphaerales bacterium]|nr:hypothetical protein [Sedimentisphaerales bacterium]HRS11529.1 hypothetical protein [Sedimentisphaerales bacterium]HRV48219.1 hypothetical protein [Sedimentisphaerales bacterium]